MDGSCPYADGCPSADRCLGVAERCGRARALGYVPPTPSAGPAVLKEFVDALAAGMRPGHFDGDRHQTGGVPSCAFPRPTREELDKFTARHARGHRAGAGRAGAAQAARRMPANSQ